MMEQRPAYFGSLENPGPSMRLRCVWHADDLFFPHADCERQRRDTQMLQPPKLIMLPISRFHIVPLDFGLESVGTACLVADVQMRLFCCVSNLDASDIVKRLGSGRSYIDYSKPGQLREHNTESCNF